MVDVESWEGAKESYRCPAFSAEKAFGGSYAPHFDAGTIIALDGAEHAKRRKVLGGLLENQAWYRDDVLVPAVERNLKDVLDSADRGVAAIDLVPFNMRVAQQMAAAIVGLDNALTTDGVDRLLHLVQSLGKAEGKYELVSSFDEDEVMPRVLAARHAIHDEFYTGALVKRTGLLEQVLAGELDRDELPRDLITLLLVHGPEAGIDADTAFREVLLMLTAGTMTTALGTTWTVHELLGWFDENPEDRALVDDGDFLLAAFNEALRLHPGAGANLRRATDDVELGDGTVVNSDDFVLIHKARANRDPDVFGDDVNEFDPHRVLPAGVQGHGLAFGHGIHKCFGMPLVIGNRSTEGIALQILRRLFAAGIASDPDREPKKFSGELAGGFFDQWASYPLLLGETA